MAAGRGSTRVALAALCVRRRYPPPGAPLGRRLYDNNLGGSLPTQFGLLTKLEIL